MNNRATRTAVPMVIAMLVGLISLARFAEGVRSVAVVGLFAGGMAFGAGLVRLILQWRGQLRDADDLAAFPCGVAHASGLLAHRGPAWPDSDEEEAYV